MATTDGLPSYLSTPPASTVGPPVETRGQALPYESLRWEDFERLCLRCARTESDVERAHQYGERGQAQAGIDLYARLRNGGYRVYQCKNEKDFGPAKIRSAVERFLSGEWASTASELVLCTRESLKATQRSDEFEKLAAELIGRRITLTAWDSGALDELLKEKHSLVDDFFGRPWVKRFCGEEAANSLGDRLDASDVQTFRRDLRAFYSNLFLMHDRGLPSGAIRTGTPLSVYQRYVLPWVYLPQRNDSAPPEASAQSQADEALNNDDRGPSLSPVSRQAPRRQRVQLESWLVGTQRAIVVADFGVGKTSLLRFLALDMLDDSPKLQRLATQWSGRLPVWVPFALWTRLITDSMAADTSLSDLLRKWLHSQDEDRLWPLVQRALKDERLLLLVDGLDEWSNPAAANIAGQRLALFVSQRELPVVAVGRPAGVSRLSLTAQDWTVGELADFDPIQQRELSRQWVEHWIRCEGDGVDPREVEIRARAKVDELMLELSSPELGELSKVPLLLSLLILLKLNNITLPDDRFKAYDELLKHLITVHPQRRREVAGTGEISSLAADDAARVIAYLAYAVQRDHSEGTIERVAAIQIVEEYLRSDDGLGFGKPEAKRHARELIETEGASTGLLVRRSETEIGFFHRSLQEYLAAQHLARLPLEMQLQVVRGYCHDATWHEVLLGLLRLTSRPDDARCFAKEMEAARLNPIERFDLEVLLAEAAVGDYNLPPSLARRLLDHAIGTIETGSWLPHRERLLSRLLRGMRQSPAGDRIRRKVSQWFPSNGWRGSLFGAVATWENWEEAFEAVWRGLYDDDLGNQRAAASAIVQRAAGAAEVGDRLARACRFDQNHMTRAVTLEALAAGWPEHLDLDHAIEAARESPSPTLRWAAISARIAVGTHTADDRQQLMEMGTRRSSLGFQLRREIPWLLAKGWSNCADLKSQCLKSLEYGRQSGSFDNNLALETVLRGFPGDAEVAASLARRIETDQFPFVGIDSGYSTGWKLLAANFKSSDLICKAIDDWIERGIAMGFDLAFAVLVGQTPKGKAKLLASLDSTDAFIHWPAFGLLEGWGIADPEVCDRLVPLARDVVSGARIAHLLPRIIEDRTECRELLMSMLARDRCPRPDFVIDGLRALNATKANSHACTLALDQHARARADRPPEIASRIITAFPDDPRVRPLALAELDRANGDDAAVATAFESDPEIRSFVLARLAPLPTQLRDRIVGALADRPIGDEFANAQLRLYAREHDSEVRTKACIAFHRRLFRSGADIGDAVRGLRDELISYGVDQAAQRQAAFCGLLELHQIQVFLEAKEYGNRNEGVVVPLEGLSTVNYALLHCIGQHWDKLREVMGATLESRLVDYVTSRKGLPWDTLSLVAAEYPPLLHELLALIESPNAPQPTSNILKFIMAARPKSLLLREKCLEVLRGHNTPGPTHETEPLAAELLAANYRDGDTFGELLRLTLPAAPGRAYGALLALADGWPESDEIELRKSQLKGQYVPWDLYFALGTDTAHEFIAGLADFCQQGGFFDLPASRRIFKFCVRSVAGNDQSYQLLLGHWLRPIDANLFVSAPGIVAASRGVGPIGRLQLMDRLERELEGKLEPHLGYDLRSDQIRSVALVLLDILTAGEARG